MRRKTAVAFLADVIQNIAQTGNIFLDDDAYKLTKTLNKRKDEVGQLSRSVGDMLAMFRTKIASLKNVASGDLAAPVAKRSKDDTIGKALAGMVESLNGMFVEINTASALVSEGSNRLAGDAHTLAQGSVEQAEAVTELSRTVEGINEETTQNAEMARQAAALSDSIRLLAEESSGQMAGMTEAVRRVDEAGDKIRQVIKAIEDIAFQTNILALNASVEAARAGAHGKGFAVVAGEVRSLAAKSQKAAGESETLIADSAERAREGRRLADETASSLNEIVGSVSESARLTEEIAASSDRQAAAIAQINASIGQLRRAVGENSKTAADSADSSREVSGQSERLRELIGKFKL
ncbi:MAG: methyl-accepting chemotaxis protein [Oscillospiraceae bacterium]|nr:methyl-accepting chemotaxis protein [Oscillospiraceae bacterium]